eukprot:Rmarinus@m.13497
MGYSRLRTTVSVESLRLGMIPWKKRMGPQHSSPRNNAHPARTAVSLPTYGLPAFACTCSCAAWSPSALPRTRKSCRRSKMMTSRSLKGSTLLRTSRSFVSYEKS